MNRDSDALAARLATAGNQPPVVLAVVPPREESASTEQGKTAAVEPKETLSAPVEEAKPRKPRKTKAALDAEKEDTVPISLRPPRALLTRYVVAASERSLASGRIISAQQIMLEVLERGP
ncbi:MAG: hypothetical protein WA324_27325 [Bryobacteraceae bacterium]